MNRVVKTKLACVNLKEAAQIGRNLVPSLKSKKLIDAGVDQWRVQNRSVKELMEERIWFQPMTVVLGKGIVKTAAWGLLGRVTIGALMSVGDLATDILGEAKLCGEERSDELGVRHSRAILEAFY